jgi:hypothetical protein
MKEGKPGSQFLGPSCIASRRGFLFGFCTHGCLLLQPYKWILFWDPHTKVWWATFALSFLGSPLGSLIRRFVRRVHGGGYFLSSPTQEILMWQPCKRILNAAAPQTSLVWQTRKRHSFACSIKQGTHLCFVPEASQWDYLLRGCAIMLLRAGNDMRRQRLAQKYIP